MQLIQTKEILVFKTNIRYKKQINVVKQYMDVQPRVLKWNVDLQDADRVLRVESHDLPPKMIETIIRAAGYLCEELPD